MGKTVKPIQYTPGFLLFWAQCLRKKGKQQAQHYWNEHGLEPRAGQVADKMAYDVKTDFSKRPIQKVPYPGTWINQGCYDDEIEDAGQSKQRDFELWVDSMVAQGYDRKNWMN